MLWFKPSMCKPIRSWSEFKASYSVIKKTGGGGRDRQRQRNYVAIFCQNPRIFIFMQKPSPMYMGHYVVQCSNAQDSYLQQLWLFQMHPRTLISIPLSFRSVLKGFRPLSPCSLSSLLDLHQVRNSCPFLTGFFIYPALFLFPSLPSATSMIPRLYAHFH